MNKLVEIVVLSFLRNPGRSVLAPNEGSGLRGDMGQYNYSDSNTDEVQVLCVQRTRAVQLEVVSRQDPSSGTPSERLQSLTLTNFAFDPINGQTMLGVKVINEAGDSANILV